MSLHKCVKSTKRRRKRPRSFMVASFLTTSFVLSFNIALPSWNKIVGELGYRNTTNQQYKRFIYFRGPSQVNAEENHHYYHHGVVRRSRRDEGELSSEVDTHVDWSTKQEIVNKDDEIVLNNNVLSTKPETADKTNESTNNGHQEQSTMKESFSDERRNLHLERKFLLKDKSDRYKHKEKETNDKEQREREQEQRFLNWCRDILGIYTILEIQTFPYIDYMNSNPMMNLEDDIEQTIEAPISEPQSTIQVRGLAASTDIREGDVVIRIPLKALWSVSTTIDTDPILGGNVMGPEARERFGWDNGDNVTTPGESEDMETEESKTPPIQLYEMPLLAVALLYHVELGQDSVYAPYIDLLKSTSVDSMPFLWSAHRLKTSPAASEGVRTVARGIRQEMRDMYEAVVQVLINQHPTIFGKDAAIRNGHEWMYSYEKFQWAFAIVNSRHWQLPIADLEISNHRPERRKAERLSVEVGSSASVDEPLPPAATPTEHWVQELGDVDDELRLEDDVKISGQDSRRAGSLHLQATASHSFLAPVADLLNFGPPCTRSRYNQDSHTFEIIASCDFLKGQEVTFWYSDECQHVIAGVYGFSHPLIPACPTSEEFRVKNEELEEKLALTYAELEEMVKELDHFEEIFDGCECCRYKRKSTPGSSASSRRNEAPSARGSPRMMSMKRGKKSSIRRLYSRKSEF